MDNEIPPEDLQLHGLRLARVQQIAEDDLRGRSSPEIRHDVNVMADILRELVKTERDKAGLNTYEGAIRLIPNKNKRSSHQPDFQGKGDVAGIKYDASAWIERGAIQITLTAPLEEDEPKAT